ncbi:ribosome biogenesis protein MAK21 [Mytilus galloprovincialis]|uniref:CCAAT/enhancer-binding protein zeta n=2 Tax=Mytilus galloprovincialis TaxID=29158 RepID=A0A8B6E2W1_MYTGA|nr:ribosome biogenesis protein MAK21 [Mytilus galloprovincialis]
MSKKVSRVSKKEIDLEFIEALGGEKGDLDLLEDLDDDEDENEDLDDFDVDMDADPIKRDELKEFIKQLGIKEHRDGEGKKEKKKKLLVMKPEEEEEVKPEKSSKKKKKEKIQHDEVSSTTARVTFDLAAHMKNYKPRPYLVVKSGQNWMDIQAPDDKVRMKQDHSRELEQQMENFASKLLQDEVAVYNKQREASKKSDVGWIKTVLSSGTLGDKIAALTLLVQESPIQNLTSLESLINMTKKKGKRECMMAADTTKELFLTYLLPNDRKLHTFDQNPLSSLGELSGGNKDTIDKYLMVWYFESKLKEHYSKFVNAIELMSHDTLLPTKQKALGIIFDLLVGKPEQEKVLLNLLVNKVGDPNYKLASKTAYLLRRLVEKHPNMKSVVVDEVERLLYRPNISSKAQYYSICFLNQLMLSREDKLLAAKLVTVYFSFFKSFVKKGEVDSKMMSALLTGVNRSYPYAAVDPEYLSEQLHNIYKLVHVVNFNTSLQALMLLYQVMDSSETVSDRYYTALYKKMSDPELKSSSKQSMFLNLLFKSIKKDTVDRRTKAFIKRLLQICSSQPAQFVCGALVLLGELVKLKPSVIVGKHMVEESDDDEDEHFTDLPDPDSDSGNKETQSQTTIKENPSSWDHRSKDKNKSSHYDPQHRNPLYCNAENECIWELKQLKNHFHPTVSLFATKLVKGEPVTYTGNPLEDFTTIRFLDRFVYKNPKKRDALPEATMTIKKHNKASAKGIKNIPVNSEKYLENTEESIPAEELFYYRYFSQKAARKKTDDDNMSDTESVSDGEFDAYLDDYEKNLEPGHFDEDDYDFASEVKKKMKKKIAEDVDDDSDDEEEEESEDEKDFSDEEVDFEGDEDFANAFKEYDEDMIDEENIEFSDDDELPGPSVGKKKKQKKDDKSSTKKKKKDDGVGLFAAAEEFSHLMDDNTDLTGGLMIGTDAVSNKDNAHIKQIKWEADRDRKMRQTRPIKRHKKQKTVMKKRKR